MFFQEYLIQNQNTTFEDFIENAFNHFEKNLKFNNRVNFGSLQNLYFVVDIN